MNEDDKNGRGGDDDEFGGMAAGFGDGMEPESRPSLTLVPDGDSEGGLDDAGGPEEAEPGTDPIKIVRRFKKARRPTSKKEKAISIMLRRAGLESLPPLEELMKGKQGSEVQISSIAVFTGEPKDDVLAELSKKFTLQNSVNLSAEVTLQRVLVVGAEILTAGRMFQPIQVAHVDDTLQCTSGRHRLAFLALAYGADAKIPVYIEEMTLNEARDAVVVANQSRPTKAMEKAEHAVLRSVGGDADARQDEIYRKMVKSKASAQKYCVYSVLERGYPLKLSFPVSLTGSRKDGLTTIPNLSGFWSSSIDWNEDVKKDEFDSSLKGTVTFLNGMVAEMQKCEGFNPMIHLGAKPLCAIGKFYRTCLELTGKVPDPIMLSRVVVSLEEIGRQRSEKTYQDIAKVMR